MKIWMGWLALAIGLGAILLNCDRRQEEPAMRLRGLADTVGFAHTAKQMDSVIQRIDSRYRKEREDIFKLSGLTGQMAPRMVICPHDDYTYAGSLYPYVLQPLSASTIIIFGVAHKARLFGAEDKIVFDTFTHWRGPYGPIEISPLREEIMTRLSADLYMVDDSLQTVEHSVEALLPFLQHYHPQVKIVSILVPYMSFERMRYVSRALAKAIAEAVQQKEWKWGRDFAIAISNDCVHYGDADWGGKNYARFGADSAGYREATSYDMNIIRECLIDQIEPQRVQRFIQYTVRGDNYKEYAWTWCGRYSVPFGLLAGYYLQNQVGKGRLTGKMLRYATSLSQPPLSVSDLKMGKTAPANIRHWVGYTAIAYFGE